MTTEEKTNYKCLFLAFSLLTFVYLLSEYTLYKLDSFLDDCLDDEDATLEINIHIHGSNGSEVEQGDESEGVEVNSTILQQLLGSLMREKRQAPAAMPVVPGYVCTADLFRKVDYCCPTPVFISEREMQNCQRRRFARSADAENTTAPTDLAPQLRNLSQSEIELGYDMGSQEYYDLQEDEEVAGENKSLEERPPPANAPAFYFRWSPMRIIQMPQRRYYNNNNRVQRVQSQPMIGRKTPVRQICMVDCMFRSLRWISPESMLNAELMYTAMMAMVPPSWGTLLTTAKTDCAAITTGAGLMENVRDGNGKVCLVAPIRLMRCIKRSLLMACPSWINNGPQCMADMNVLKTCDILSI